MRQKVRQTGAFNNVINEILKTITTITTTINQMQESNNVWNNCCEIFSSDDVYLQSFTNKNFDEILINDTGI